MSIEIETTDGVTVDNGSGHELTQEQAEASVEDRNRRAEELGIRTRYQIREGTFNG